MGHKDTKFGFSARNGIYLKAIQQIADSTHIEFEGIHCHIGSQVFDLYAYISAMHRFVRFAYEIYDQLGVMVKVINAGGGYGIAYTKKDEPLEFETITSEIMNIILVKHPFKGLYVRFPRHKNGNVMGILMKCFNDFYNSLILFIICLVIFVST